MLKRILSSLLVFTMLFVLTVSASAATPKKILSDTQANHFSMDNISESDQEFLKKMVQVFDGYVTNAAGVITFTYSDEQLSEIGFTQTEITELSEINSAVCGVSMTDADDNYESNTAITPQMFVEDGIVYFDNADVDAFLFAAASLGPEAVYAALVALGSVTLGPVGTVIVTIVGLIGAPSLASFCYYVIQAATYGEGVYIGVEMNGVFPNIISGTW